MASRNGFWLFLLIALSAIAFTGTIKIGGFIQASPRISQRETSATPNQVSPYKVEGLNKYNIDGISLGMEQQEVQGILGKPSERKTFLPSAESWGYPQLSVIFQKDIQGEFVAKALRGKRFLRHTRLLLSEGDSLKTVLHQLLQLGIEEPRHIPFPKPHQDMSDIFLNISCAKLKVSLLNEQVTTVSFKKNDFKEVYGPPEQ